MNPINTATISITDSQYMEIINFLAWVIIIGFLLLTVGYIISSIGWFLFFRRYTEFFQKYAWLSFIPIARNYLFAKLFQDKKHFPDYLIWLFTGYPFFVYIPVIGWLLYLGFKIAIIIEFCSLFASYKTSAWAYIIYFILPVFLPYALIPYITKQTQ